MNAQFVGVDAHIDPRNFAKSRKLMTLPFRGAVTAKPTEGFCKDLTVGSSVRGGSREKIKIQITN